MWMLKNNRKGLCDWRAASLNPRPGAPDLGKAPNPKIEHPVNKDRVQETNH